MYKGGGKDPLNANSYRGITLNSVISKVLETLILNRLEPLFMEAGLPHDIRTLASSTTTLEAQISTIKKFTEDNFLKLNTSKCEIVAFKKSSSRTNIEVGECSLPVSGEAICLGYQWKQG